MVIVGVVILTTPGSLVSADVADGVAGDRAAPGPAPVRPDGLPQRRNRSP